MIQALNAYAARVSIPPTSLLLSACFSSNPNTISPLPLPEIHPLLDYLFLMAYDYAGSWGDVTAHQANLFPSTSNPASTPFSTSAAIDIYLGAGVPASKIVMGMPLYGRAFGTTAGLGKSFQGTGPSGEGKGSWEQGVWDYKALPRENEQEEYDEESGASWCWGREGVVSYDTVRAGKRKADWVKEKGLGGVGWWESSGDKVGEGSLITAVTDMLGGLEKTQNTLTFPESSYDNLKAGFPNE